MRNPRAINLTPPEVSRANGWQAESRDEDGHLIRSHCPFQDDEEIIWFVRECLEHGETITIWPMKDSPNES